MLHVGFPSSPCEEALQGKGLWEEVWRTEKDPPCSVEEQN